MNSQSKLKLSRLNSDSNRVAIAAGGTAGHIFLALAGAHGYRHRSLAEVVFFVSTSEEAQLIERNGYTCFVVHGFPVARQTLARKVWAIGNVGFGFMEARRALRSMRPDIVIGFGSYASVAPILAARSLGLRTAIHESNVTPGLANKLLGQVVDRIYLGFQEATRHFPKRRTLVTGNPVRPEVASSSFVAKEPPTGNRPARVLVTGGSSGSHFLNKEVPDLIGMLAKRGIAVEVLHQTGAGEDEMVRSAYRAAGIPASVTAYIEEMLAAYKWADFAISCAGAATLSELAAVALPSLVIPLRDAAAEHQVPNAIAFAHQAGWWVSEDKWDRTTVSQKLATVLTEPHVWWDMSRAARANANADAARILTADFEAMVGEERGRAPIAARSN